MKTEILIERIEEEIMNLESFKHTVNTRLDYVIDRIKRLGFEVKYPDSCMNNNVVSKESKGEE